MQKHKSFLYPLLPKIRNGKLFLKKFIEISQYRTSIKHD